MAVVLLCLTACLHAPPGSQSIGGSARSRRSPLSQAELPTTDGAIAIGNLQAQIDGEERLASYRPLTVSQRAGIAGLIAMRGQFLGRIADFESAEQIAEQIVREAPTDPASFLARAEARSTLHRFKEALADLEEAERLGQHGERIESPRATILAATGRYDEALAFRQRAAQARPDVGSLGALASLQSERGEIEEAQRLFIDAQYRYRDVSPFPIAWLYFQEGSMWMREGRPERARELFEAAHERLPAYAAAQGHLAEAEAALGHDENAIRLLRPLAESSDDPDYASQLARISAGAGHPEEARHWREVAATRYEELMRIHPKAFADHAAEFWLAAGGDPKKGRARPPAHLPIRRPPRAAAVGVQAALAAGERAVACEAAAHTGALHHPWPGLRILTARASTTCGEPGPNRYVEAQERDHNLLDSPADSL